MNALSTSTPAKTRAKPIRLPRPLAQGVQAKIRSLLALDGGNLTPEVLSAAMNHCRRLADRVDILLVNAPKEPTSLLHRLLVGLEQAGIDYRLTATRGELGDEITRYLRRSVQIPLIMVAALPSLGTAWNVTVADLRYRGYRFSLLGGPTDAD